MGEVYLAEDTRLGRKVALKMLPASFTMDDDRVRRFQQEARAASALNHPNILTIYEIGQLDSHHFIATEFIEGETLRQHMAQTKMDIAEALDVAMQVTSALATAHQAGIVHRDIKPENIIVRQDGLIKVLDFGLAKLIEQKQDDSEAATLVKTKQGMVMGTAHYMSPEQARGLDVDARTDLFSLGVVLYEMVTGRVPFEGETMTDVLAGILRGEAPPLNESVPAVPTALQSIVTKSLCKVREERYQAAKELLSDLKNVKQRLEFEAELATSVSPEPRDESIPQEQLQQQIQFCTTTDGVRIAYAKVGQGPPLLKAANWLNHLEFDWRSPIWRPLLEEFARDHLLVRYDERGNGLSDWNIENFSFEAMVRDLEAVVDAVGLDRFPILGISQGGPVAIAYAARHPEKVSHLILYGSYARGWARRGSPPEVIQQRQAQQTLIKLGWGQDNPAFRQLWTTLYVPDATTEQWQWFNDLQRISTSPENATRLLDELGKIDVVDLLPQVRVPTLVLHCRDEVVAPFEEGRLLAALIPGARFVPLEGRNHLLLESEPAWGKFITEVRHFLGAKHQTLAEETKTTGPAIQPANVTSSAEYVVGGIKRHKIGVAMVAAMFLLIAALVYSSFMPRSQAIDSLAVLPFINSSADPNTEYLSDGLTESIIYDTSKLPNLKVIPRSSVFRYKGKEMDAQTVGHELGVRAVLTGTVSQHGDGILISAELIDVRDNRVLWGQHYNRKITDLLAVQEEISREISDRMRLRLTGEEQKRLTKRYTENTAAYQLYLKGRYYWFKRTREGYQKATEHFEQAIEEDPSYALAYAGLADCYNVLPSYGILPPKESFAKGKAAATKALEIDDTLAEAQTSVAYVKYQYDWDWSGAESGFRRAIELNPGYATAHQWYALELAGMGRMDEAMREIKRTQELDPLSLIANVNAGWIFYHSRQYDRAIEQDRKSLDMDPNFARGHWAISEPLEQAQRYDEAIAELQRARQLDETPIMLALLGHVYAVTGKENDARKIIEELNGLSKRMYVDPYFLAEIYAALGERDQAFQELERAYDQRSSWLVWLKVEPKLDSLRSDPRFNDLLRRVGLGQ
jgi:serine/threonine protein kinase/TolB-like protein/Tfp pilus assembly protein PilF/alpha-beta hydrolase superfamily lysophospholipase